MDARQILYNFLYILTVITVVGLFLLFMKKGFDKFFKVVDLFSDLLSSKIEKLATKTYGLFFFKFLFFTCIPLMVIAAVFNLIWLAGILLIFMSLAKVIKKTEPNFLFRLGCYIDTKTKENYYFNRLILILDQGNSIIFLIVAIALTYTFIAYLSWPTPLYYLLTLVIPLYFTFWIYFSFKLKIRMDIHTVNIRRLIAYLILTVFIISENYGRFGTIFFNNSDLPLNQTNFIAQSAVVIFFALERLLKLLTEDYKCFAEDKIKDCKVTQKNS